MTYEDVRRENRHRRSLDLHPDRQDSRSYNLHESRNLQSAGRGSYNSPYAGRMNRPVFSSPYRGSENSYPNRNQHGTENQHIDINENGSSHYRFPEGSPESFLPPRKRWPGAGDHHTTNVREHTGHSDRHPLSYRGRGPKNYQRPDTRIKEDVNEVLTENDLIDASDIEVESTDGIVILRGQVNSRKEKRHAENLVDYIAGVQNVENRLWVKNNNHSHTGNTSGPIDEKTGDKPRRNIGNKDNANSMTGFTDQIDEKKKKSQTII